MAGSGAQERLVGVQRVAGPVEPVGSVLLDLINQLVAGRNQGTAVAQARLAAGGHDHPLEAVGHHRGDVVAQDVLGLRRDQLRCFEHLRGGGVPVLENLALVVAEVAEPPEEEVVHLGGASHCGVGGAALVEDRHGRAVGFGLGQRVPVEVAAEDLQRLLSLAHHDRRAGEPDPGRVGQSGHQVGVQHRRLGAVGLIDHHQDRTRLVQRVERLPRRQALSPAAGGVAVLLDHRHHHTGAGPPQQLSHLGPAAGHPDGLAGELGGAAKLPLQVGAVGDQHDLEPAQIGVAAHGPDQEHHGEALARPLGVPDDPAAAVDMAVHWPGVAFDQPLQRLVHAPVLLVAAHDLDHAARADLHEQREVPHDVEQPLRGQHPRRQQLLLGDGISGLAHRCGHLVDGGRERVLPRQIVLGQRRERRRLGPLAGGGDSELIRPEQLLRALGDLAAALVGVAAELINGVGDAAVVAGRLGLDHHQRDPVDEQRHIGPDVRRPPRRGHSELRHRKEVVGLPVVPVDVVDGLISTPVPPVKPGHRDPAQQQLGRQPVGLQQLGPRRHRPQLRNRGTDPGLVEPRRAVRATIDLLQRRAEPPLKEHIAIRQPGVITVRLALRPDQRLPPQREQMFQQRPFNLLPLRAGIHAVTVRTRPDKRSAASPVRHEAVELLECVRSRQLSDRQSHRRAPLLSDILFCAQ